MHHRNELCTAELQKHKRNLFIVVLLFVLIIVAFVMSMNTGVIRLSLLDLISTLFGYGTDQQNLILFDFRLPRIVISVLIGAGLAVSGCVLQAISRNALADPGILGINAGAGLAVLVFVAFYPSAASAPAFLLPILAWGGASVATVLVILLSYRKRQGLSSNRLLMNGVAINAGISALTIVITLRLNQDQFQFVSAWMVGSIWGKDWHFVLSLLPFIIILLPYVFMKAHTVNVLNLGNSMATGLGVFVNRQQFLLLAAAVGLAGSCVAVSGSIGFVGLITPHLSRRLVGSRFQILLPTTALTGALLVLVADTIGRWMLQPSEIPAGLVVAAIGAPYFMYLLIRAKG